MEKYKKKSLNFMGFSQDLRKIERDNQRRVSRLKRFSVIRPLDDESITEEKKENNSRIPAKGIPKPQVGSRVELLQKWKQEKMVKKQQESKLKKPVFKVGVVKPSPSPSLANKPLFALDTSSRLFKSSFQVSNSQLFGKKQESLIASNKKTTMKVPNSQSSAKKPDVPTDNLKTNTKDMKIPSSKSKIGVISKPETKWTKNKESNIQSLNVKPKVDASSKVVNKDQISRSRKLPTITSKPLETKKESRFQPLNTRSKVNSTARGEKSNIPSSGLPKPTTSRTLNKVSDQAHIPKSNAFTIPEGNSKDKHISGKNNVKSIPKFSKTIAPKQKGNISEKTNSSESEVLHKLDECELTCIEPVEEEKESFAPKGFMFQPPSELSSFFLEDGPSAIYLRMRNQFFRTSTPKKSSLNQESSPQVKDIEFPENEDIECPKNENSQCSKNTDKEFESANKHDLETLYQKSSPQIKDIEYLKNEDTECLKNENNQCSKNIHKEFEPENKHDFETLLSSSLGSVSLNEMKPVDCKQSLKFPEVISTQNQEEMFLSSKIIYPEHSLVTEPPPTAASNPPILPDSVEVDKTEINFTDTNPTGASNPTILPDSVEVDKTEINSTSLSPAGVKITVPSPEVDSVFSEGKEMSEDNTEKNQFVLNGFLQKQENEPAKIPKNIRNFRRSEKPGLMSINESLENTPKSALKKKVLEGDFTPRRSLRLAKLSGNFSSLDNLLENSKPKHQDKLGPKLNFTPRRSMRLSKFSTEFSSAENLFDVRRPTLYGTPEKDQPVPKLHSKVTYDFDRLSSEMEEETRPRAANFGKVSLLPVTRSSIMRCSIKGDLMSFSPDI